MSAIAKPLPASGKPGGVAWRQAGSKTHVRPQALPAQGSGASTGHRSAAQATQRPSGSQPFTTAVSTHCPSPGGQTRQASPQAFPSHGS